MRALFLAAVGLVLATAATPTIQATETSPVGDGELRDAVLRAEFLDRRAPAVRPVDPHIRRADVTRLPTATTATTTTTTATRPAAFGSAPGGKMRKVFGLGLSRTGTSSLQVALEQLGLDVLHFDADLTDYLRDGNSDGPVSMERRYDGVDGATDLPTALYYRELLRAYPDALFVVIHRDPADWFSSFRGYLRETSRLFAPANLPFTVTRLHRKAYGSDHPDKARWIRHYIDHYADVRRCVPEKQRLDLDFDDLSKAGTMRRLCRFIGSDLSSPQCSEATAFPRSYSLRSVSESVGAALPTQNALVLPKVGQPAKAEFAYVTLIADAQANEFKSQFVDAAIVWCRSVRLSYHNSSSSSPYDVVALVLGTLDIRARTALATCFDRVIPLHPKPFSKAPLGTDDTPYYRAVRAKFWVFSLTEYRRVQFMDADQLVVRNCDHFFFRDHYAALPALRRDAVDGRLLERVVGDACTDACTAQYNETAAGCAQEPPDEQGFCYQAAGWTYTQCLNACWNDPLPEFLAMTSNHAPINTAFFSAEPNIQTTADLSALFQHGRWSNESGWLNNGRFTWHPQVFAVAPVGPGERVWKAGDEDPDYPFLPLVPHPTDKNIGWVNASWNFYCSSADQGALFYIFYVLRGTGALLNANDVAHRIVHYIGVHKPWIHADAYTTDDNADWVRRWSAAIDHWRDLARIALTNPNSPSGEDGVKQVSVPRHLAAGRVAVFGGRQSLGDIQAFQHNVNSVRKPGLLAGLDPYKSTDARLRYLIIQYCKDEPAWQPDVMSYRCYVPYHIDNSSILAVHTYNAKAAVQAMNYPLKEVFPLIVGDTSVTVTVKAEAGNLDTYTVIITRKNSTDAQNAGGAVIDPPLDDNCTETCLTIWSAELMDCSMQPPDQQPQCDEDASTELYQCLKACPQDGHFARRVARLLATLPKRRVPLVLADGV